MFVTMELIKTKIDNFFILYRNKLITLIDIMFLTNVENLSIGSHAKVQVECLFNSSEKCQNIVEREYRDALKNMNRNNGKFICLPCSRHIKASGSNNPNCKYRFDHSMFKSVDTEEKAYLLGWIASDGHISKSNWTISIQIKYNDIDCLKRLKNIVCDDIPIVVYEKTVTMVGIEINSKEMCLDVCRLLQINRGKKSNIVNFPNLNDDELTWAFIRGYFDGDGTIRHINSHALSCSISSNSINMLTAISKFSNIPCEKITNELTYNGTNCLDFLGKLYGDASNELYLLRKYNLYLQWMNWKPSLRGSGSQSNIGLCKVYKTDKNAILPSKSNISDVGYDLTIIKEIKKNNTNTVMYDTGIKIKLDYGYYAEIVPRSSLSKSGYMLSNSIGIIDNSYRGNLYIPLTKVELDAPDLELPFKCCQLIIREQIHINMIEVAEDIIDNTTRDNGGFGSTNSN